MIYRKTLNILELVYCKRALFKIYNMYRPNFSKRVGYSNVFNIAKVQENSQYNNK